MAAIFRVWRVQKQWCDDDCICFNPCVRVWGIGVLWEMLVCGLLEEQTLFASPWIAFVFWPICALQIVWPGCACCAHIGNFLVPIKSSSYIYETTDVIWLSSEQFYSRDFGCLCKWHCVSTIWRMCEPSVMHCIPCTCFCVPFTVLYYHMLSPVVFWLHLVNSVLCEVMNSSTHLKKTGLNIANKKPKNARVELLRWKPYYISGFVYV